MANNFINNIRRYFKEYCKHSGVHGFQYIGDDKRTIFERILWFVIFTISSSICAFYIYLIYIKWEQSPIVITPANTETPIHNIPFPTVTVCPEAKTDTKKFSFTRIVQKLKRNESLTTEEYTKFHRLMLLCDYAFDTPNASDTFEPAKLFDLIEETKPVFTIEECHFLSDSLNITCSFVPIMTDEGLCYTFNMIDRDAIFRENVLHYRNYHKMANTHLGWSLQNGYSNKTDPFVYPWRAYMGKGLRFHISTPSKDNDFACKDAIHGYKIVLNTPADVPRPSYNFFKVPLDQRVAIAVQPTMVTTSEQVQNYDVDRRRCYFDDERRLQFFKNYTAANCRLECLTNITLTLGCVNYFMPIENTTKICNASSLTYLKKTDLIFTMSKIMLHMESIKSAFKKGLNKICMECLPTCSSLYYEGEATETAWKWKKPENYTNSSDKFYKAAVTIYFKSDIIATLERSELYGPLDFLANFGGLLGLFTGFSLFSLIEILYFLTIRIVANKFLYGFWAGPGK